MHAGKPAAVLGAGPSLRFLQPEMLDGFIVTTLNSAFVKYPDCDYFLTGDRGRVNHWSWHQLHHHHCTVFMTTVGWWQPNLAEWASLPPERIVPFDGGGDDYRMYPAAETICGSHSSAQAAAHLAHIMGCTPIVLLGCDCTWEDGKLHFHAFEGQPQDPILVPYHRTRQVTGERPADAPAIDGNQRADMRAWGEIARANPDVAIWNASGGALDVFPRISMDALPTLV